MRVLVIASYNGLRRDRSYSATDYLKGQLDTLSRFKHSLDDVIVVVNEGPMDDEYREVLRKFSIVLYRPNVQASRGAWNFAWETFKDKYEWYFYTEDDYRFNLDNFDQKLIDMWEPNVGHLCSYAWVHPHIGYHIGMTIGLISAEGFKAADFSIFNDSWERNVYNTFYQRSWDDAFINSSLKVKSIVPTYDVHYLDIDGSVHELCGDTSIPNMIVPVQTNSQRWIPDEQIEEIRNRELMEDRHRQRLIEDEVYREKWGET